MRKEKKQERREMNNVFYPGGQPYTPPHEATEEDLEQVRKYLEEMKKRRVEKIQSERTAQRACGAAPLGSRGGVQ